MAYGIIALLGVVLVAVVFLLMRRRKRPEPTGQAIYGGPIRFTDPSGRNMKIIRKDDGSFETTEE